MTNVNKGQAYDWNMTDVEDNDNHGVTLPKGTYPYRVRRLEREYFQGSERIDACPRAHLTLEVDGGDEGKAFVHDRIYLNTKSGWKIAQLFASLGFAKNDNGHRIIDWGAVEGKSGYAKIGTHDYKDQTYNCVDDYIAADNAPRAAAKPAANAWG